jgi:hypothetical protein
MVLKVAPGADPTECLQWSLSLVLPQLLELLLLLLLLYKEKPWKHVHFDTFYK